MMIDFPLAWAPISKELESKRRKVFGYDNLSQINFFKCVPYGVFAQEPMIEACKKICNFKVRLDDIWIVTYPKCGTTWTQVVWKIMLVQCACFFTKFKYFFAGVSLANCSQY